MADLASCKRNSERRVLVVADDHEEGALGALLASLRRQGWQVAGVSRGLQGLESLQASPAQVVIAGSRLPDMTGLDFLCAIQARFPAVQRILAAGGGEHRAFEEAVARGALLRLLSWPWEDAQLRLTVAAAIEQYDLAEEHRALLERARGQQLAPRGPPLEDPTEKRAGPGAFSAEEWERVFDSIEHPIAVLSPALRVLRANRAYAALVTVSPEKLEGRHCHELLFGHDAPCADCPLARGESAAGPAEIVHGGRTFAFSSYAVGSPAEGRTVCVFRETSEERQGLRRTVQAEKQLALGRLAGTLAHEINNPLGAILAFSQLMQRDHGRTAEDLETLLDIERAAVRCKNTLAALLKLGRGGASRTWATFDLNDAVLDAALLFRLHLGAREGIAFDTELCAQPLRVRWDASLLHQVVVALLSNSLHALGNGGGQIRLLTRGGPAGAEVVIEDDGEAVSADDLSRLCERSCSPMVSSRTAGAGPEGIWNRAASQGCSLEASARAGRGNLYLLRLPLPGSGPVASPQAA